MTTQQLIDRLQQIIRKNPDAAHKPIVVSQYDSVESVERGYETASSVDEGHNRVIIG